MLEFTVGIKKYELPFSRKIIDKIPKEKDTIFNELVFNKKYNVQSNVGEATFKSFLHYWESDELPELSETNIWEYQQLSTEFGMLTDYLSKPEFLPLFNLNSLINFHNDQSFDLSSIELKIAQNLNYYLADHSNDLKHIKFTTLYNIFNHPERNLSDQDKAYEFIVSAGEEDAKFFSLLNSLDSDQMKSEKNKLDSCIKSKEHFGFLPKNAEESFLKYKEDLIQSLKEEKNQLLARVEKDQEREMEKVIQYSESIVVGGYDTFNQLGETPTDKTTFFCPVIFPPKELNFDSSSHLSYSVCAGHSVEITSSFSLLGVGYNGDRRISRFLDRKKIKELTEFCIKNDEGDYLMPISAVCYRYGTLYMLSKSDGIGRQLVLCDRDISYGFEFVLDIGDEEPMSLFGGYYYTAAISTSGKIIFINPSPNPHIRAYSLPEGEKASSVAFLDNFVIVLSSSGRVFESKISDLNFSEVPELSKEEIICVSGTMGHCLAVSKEGLVFGRGSNCDGQLGLGKVPSFSSFTKILSLFKYKIRAAYAGSYHSLFETREGKILACGRNLCGQLLINDSSRENVYSPKETMINSGATFCIAGSSLSVVFIGGEPPPNTPNRRIKQHQ